MVTNTVRLDWIKEQIFLLRDHNGAPVVMSQTGGVSGSDLLAMGLIGCTAWDVIGVMRKQRQEVTSFEIIAESEQDDEPPWRFRRIRVRYKLVGKNLEEDKIERAIALSEQKYCSVYATLRDAVEITSEYECANDES
jgi:putative redox protein